MPWIPSPHPGTRCVAAGGTLFNTHRAQLASVSLPSEKRRQSSPRGAGTRVFLIPGNTIASPPSNFWQSASASFDSDFGLSFWPHSCQLGGRALAKCQARAGISAEISAWIETVWLPRVAQNQMPCASRNLTALSSPGDVTTVFLRSICSRGRAICGGGRAVGLCGSRQWLDLWPKHLPDPSEVISYF